jgi:RimJ/RimL family protein N-acetyltransferase
MLRLKLFTQESQFIIAEHYFNEVKENFNPAFDKFTDLVKEARGHSYYCTWDDKFIGCLFLYRWDYENVYMMGFSKRHNPYTVASVKLLVDGTFDSYPFIKKILSTTDKTNKPAQICLRRAGFSFVEQINNDYLYEYRKGNNEN